MLRIFAALHLMVLVTNLEIRLGSENISQSPIVFKNNRTSSYFNFPDEKGSGDCSDSSIYYENPDENNNLSFFQFLKQSPNEVLSNVIVYTNNNRTSSFFQLHENSANNTILLQILHKCSSQQNEILNISSYTPTRYFHTSKYDDNWALIKVQFEVNSQAYDFQYIKLCQVESFIPGLLTSVLMFIVAGVYIYLSTIFEIDIELANQIREQNEIKWWHALIIICAGSLFLLLIFYLFKYIIFIYTLLISVQSLFCIWLIMNWLFKNLFNRSPKSRKLVILIELLKLEAFHIKIYKYISGLVAICIVVIWYVSRHWLFNNLLAFCLVFSVLSLLAIKSFKVCFFLLLAVFIYDSFWVFFSEDVFSQNVMATTATSVNLPIKIELPVIFSSNPIRDCSLLGLGDIAIPGMVVKYCRLFDVVKNYQTKKWNYYKLCLLFYFVSLFLAMLMMYAFNHSQPVLFYISPIFIIGLLVKSVICDDMYDFWRGKNITGTQQAVDEIISGEFMKLDKSDGNSKLQLKQ